MIDRLDAAGFTAYLAGGCVRDALLGKTPKDYDVATDATPEAICEVFGKRQTLAFGASFGVIGVLPPRSLSKNRDQPVEPTEVATFRSDGDYSDGRRPDSVHFGSAEADAQRRDFTINGLFYDPKRGQVIDFVSGQRDLDRQILRTIGDPGQRFAEDKLRMLRAVRFTTTLGFQVDQRTAMAICKSAAEIVVVSGERVGVEMRRTMVSPNVLEGLSHLSALGLSPYVLPELDQADQEQLAQLLAEKRTRTFVETLACFLFSIQRHQAGLREITRRWRLSNEEVRKVTAAIEHAPVLATANTHPWSKVQPSLVHRDAATIVAVSRVLAQSTGADPEGLRLVEQAITWPTQKLDPTPLISGGDLADLGIPSGPEYAKILQQVRDMQLDGQLQSRQDAIDWMTAHDASD
ncbi:tRNA nucleotidyltransferase/poly(A) polymerase [Novipirellula artificiosorum]|uniref:tRNA nucleotidyltransferase/poly(A) polymerase n=1 Tax=Novipirellula artificiosorum TaxID=2528016 RepID=A0A5C6DR21_9BACT|nr:tRNA nucleotidyltransferase/poly(A) polymerase [Novipirellula artificiosorum]